MNAKKITEQKKNDSGEWQSHFFSFEFFFSFFFVVDLIDWF